MTQSLKREMGGEKYRHANGRSCLIKCSIHSLVIILVVITITLYYDTFGRNISVFLEVPTSTIVEISQPVETLQDTTSTPTVNDEVKLAEKEDDVLVGSCDFFSGKWIYDNESYPLYKDRDCAFMFDDLACEKYGRPDLRWQHWRWQPNECDLPRFDAKAFLEKLRNKRLMFVGDSVNRNQWVSMMCLVESVIPRPFKFMKMKDPLYRFKATEYNASIDFYWNPFLVESNNDNSSNHRLADRMIKPEAIEKHANAWKDADFLVFNSYLWWRVPTLKTLQESGSFEDPNEEIKRVKSLTAFKMVLKKWSDWLKTNVNQTKTRMFFMGLPATHEWSIDWGNDKNRKCLDETEPISDTKYWGRNSNPKFLKAIESSISKLKNVGFDIQLINITQLSEYRKDGHPSIYKKLWHPLTKEQMSNPRNYADCAHWCLPGVPDVWNEIILAHILN